MTTDVIRERLQNYIRSADDKKVQAIYTIVESEIQSDLDLWENAEFLNELKDRDEEYLANPSIAISLDQLQSEIRNL